MSMMQRCGWSLVGAMVLAFPNLKVQAADTIILSFGALEFPVAVAELETYIKTGQVPSKFQPFINQVPPQDLARMIATLKQPIPVTTDTVARVFGTSTGQVLLSRLGLVVQTDRGENGANAVKTALLQAAKQPGGVTFLSVLREFPSPTMRLNLVRGLAIMNQVNRYIAQVNGVFTVLNNEFQQQARQPLPPNLPNLTQPGTFKWQVQQLSLADPKRQRTLPVTVYLPSRDNAPTVVISHGLGDSRQSFAYLAQHLASHGFGVILPEHPGSDAQKLQQVLEGKATEYIIPAELVDRPLDITFVLNALAAQPGLTPALNLKQVAVVGHSYGGYTALAVGGARLNLANLNQVCTEVEQGVGINLSLLLQCPGRSLQNPPAQFRDERVAALMAVNPVGSALFGETGLAQVKIPTFLVTATQDIAAPSLYEQIIPFTWLGSPRRYLAILEGASHFSILGAGAAGLPLPVDLVGPAPEVAQMYMKVLTLAFAQVHLANQPQFAPFLTAAYARQLSRAPLPLQVLNDPPLNPIKQALAE
ncbi:Putative dienelactone hydrolase [Gloeomargarita lithophora Alchichica-D10]|uniref:Dienelactone hydrolase n=1 Tax=Gloeomargarita lithophora Alchichica-D10 TaxID=1188229 RepID=A0A1J0AGZ4_9CYAN|nr:alpha/beta hydrolase [Gloeomargarita lithophora]APB35220.1 Putative dienelactone hydrolase [Gloeomargarita lithophora Alchichica-D10]